MTDYPESGVKLVADTADYTAQMDAAVDLAGQFDAIGTVTIDVAASVDESGADLSGLPTDGEEIGATINVTESEDTKAVLSGFSEFAGKAIATTWNVVGTAVDVFKSVGGFAVQPMLELDTALAHVKATTGEVIPGADKLINKIFYEDLGTSITQVANLITKAQQIKAPLEEGVTSALKFTKVFEDQNPEEVLNTLNQLVVNKLEPNFTQAGNDLVTAFQNGANRGKDLLTTLNNNATAIHDMGMTGPQALSFIKTGMDNGFTSADAVLKTLEKIKTNVQSAAGKKNSVSETLDQIGIANPAETGQAWSADFFSSVIKGIQDAPVSDSEKMVMFQNLVGGKLSAKEFSSFMKMSPEDAAGVFENTKGAADRAASDIKGSLSGAIEEFTRLAQGAAVDFLSSKQIDLPGKIDALKKGLQDGLSVLAQGGTLSDALTIALKPVGLDEVFSDLESTMGNFVISLLQVVSSLQSLSPSNWDAKKVTDATITRMSGNQLTSDLKIANTDEVATDISTAVSRGLTQGQVAEAVSNTISELIKTGTADSLAQAQLLIDTLKKPIDQNTLPTLASGAPMNVEPVITPEGIDALQAKLDASKPVTVTITATADDKLTDNIWPGLKTSLTETTGPVDGLSTSIDTAGTNATQATPAIASVASSTKTQGDNAQVANTPVKNLANDTKQVGDNAKAAAPQVASVSSELSAIVAIAPSAVTALTNIWGAIGKIITQAGELAADNDKKANPVGGTGATPTTDSGGAGDGPGIIAATNHYIPGASSSGSGGHSFNVINNNLIQNEAQADAVGYSTAKQLRGMA